MMPSIQTSRRAGQPLLSITIPTFNRAPFLAELLECLRPQLAHLAADEVELLISDNCSEDDTPQVIAGLQQRGLLCRYVRNAVNIGSDANFLQCFELAAGQYVLILGDDDILLPHAVASLRALLPQREVDLVHLSSFSFTDSAAIAPEHDRLGRTAEIVTDGEYFLHKVNALIGLISANLVNKNRLLATPHPPLINLVGTNLVQVGWLFPLIRRRCEILYIWDRLLAYRSYNSGGWGAMEVFGVRLERIAAEYFTAEPALASALINGMLQSWMCDAVINLRRGLMAEMNEEDFVSTAHHIYAHNWRFWVFVFPVAQLPLPIARIVYVPLRALTRALRVVEVLARHLFRRGTYLHANP